MIEDAKHLQVLDGLAKEIENLVVHYNSRANGVTDKAALIELRLTQNEDLTTLLSEHRRVLKFMRGDKIEPKVHFAEAVVNGSGGGGMV